MWREHKPVHQQTHLKSHWFLDFCLSCENRVKKSALDLNPWMLHHYFIWELESSATRRAKVSVQQERSCSLQSPRNHYLKKNLMCAGAHTHAHTQNVRIHEGGTRNKGTCWSCVDTLPARTRCLRGHAACEDTPAARTCCLWGHAAYRTLTLPDWTCSHLSSALSKERTTDNTWNGSRVSQHLNWNTRLCPGVLIPSFQDPKCLGDWGRSPGLAHAVSDFNVGQSVAVGWLTSVSRHSRKSLTSSRWRLVTTDESRSLRFCQCVWPYWERHGNDVPLVYIKHAADFPELSGTIWCWICSRLPQGPPCYAPSIQCCVFLISAEGRHSLQL